MQNPQPKKEGLNTDVKHLAEDLNYIFTAADKIENVRKNPTMHEWMRFIEEFLAPSGDLPDDKVIGFKLKQLENYRSFKSRFPENKKCLVAVIPCDFGGNTYDKDDIEHGEYLQIHVVPEESENMGIYEKQIKLLYDFMPDEVKKYCTFNTGRYENSPDGEGDGAVSERAKVLAKVSRAMLKWREFWKQYLRDPEQLN